MNTINKLIIIIFIFTLSSCHHKPDSLKTLYEPKSIKEAVNVKPQYAVIADSKPSEWRDLDQDNALYITLPTGQVVVELSPTYAPIHVSNTKTLASEGIFDGTSFYRVIDGFVAQGGPADPTKIPKPKSGKLSIPAEFSIITEQPIDITPVGEFDGFAAETGFHNGFAVGRSEDGLENWMLHCYAALGMGRGNEPDSGGTELYFINGNSQRYLDLNVTVFGRVVAGMEHIQYLRRTSGLNGAIEPGEENKIIKIAVGSSLKTSEQLPLEIMDTSSESFKQIIAARKNRSADWFIHKKNYTDACAVPVPSRLKVAVKE